MAKIWWLFLDILLVRLTSNKWMQLYRGIISAVLECMRSEINFIYNKFEDISIHNTFQKINDKFFGDIIFKSYYWSFFVVSFLKKKKKIKFKFVKIDETMY
jgi:hypothetical protein